MVGVLVVDPTSIASASPSFKSQATHQAQDVGLLAQRVSKNPVKGFSSHHQTVPNSDKVSKKVYMSLLRILEKNICQDRPPVIPACFFYTSETIWKS